jgi:Tfp pilus assembly protein PilV
MNRTQFVHPRVVHSVRCARQGQGCKTATQSPASETASLPSGRRWRRDQAGETLIEVLFAIGVLGIAVVALVGGLLNAVTISSVHRDDAVIETVLRDYAETMKQAVLAQCPQGTVGNFTANWTPPAGYSVTPTPPYTAACPSPTTTGTTPQITLTATGPTGGQGGPPTRASLTIVLTVP